MTTLQVCWHSQTMTTVFGIEDGIKAYSEFVDPQGSKLISDNHFDSTRTCTVTTANNTLLVAFVISWISRTGAQIAADKSAKFTTNCLLIPTSYINTTYELEFTNTTTNDTFIFYPIGNTALAYLPHHPRKFMIATNPRLILMTHKGSTMWQRIKDWVIQ